MYEKKSIFGEVIEGIVGLVDSYYITLLHLFRKPITEQYPEFKRPLPARSRGRIVLTRDQEGKERCVSCYLCASVCPTDCISMEGGELENGRRYPLWFRINFARCIYCGFCEDACPTLAIQLTPDYEFSKHEVLDFIYEKEDLLIDNGGKNKEYNFYRHSGVAVEQDKGEHINEEPPVDVKSNMP
jgi:NADH-quinone oxidoreductase subunit I